MISDPQIQILIRIARSIFGYETLIENHFIGTYTGFSFFPFLFYLLKLENFVFRCLELEY